MAKSNLGETHSYLRQEWNDVTSIDNYSYGSSKSVSWKCSEGHVWEARVKDRTRKDKPSGCPDCSKAKRRHVDYKNSLAFNYHSLSEDWDIGRNYPLLPSDVSSGSGKNVFWICSSCSLSWKARICDRTRKNNPSGCPDCSKKSRKVTRKHQVLPRENSLLCTHPSLLKEWDSDKNNPLQPSDVSKGSHYVAHWICYKGHEWVAPVYRRTNPNKASGCPVCALCTTGGYFTEKHPELVKEINFEKENLENISRLSFGSAKIVNWICPQNHTWKTAVYSRTILKSGCPQCRYNSKASKGEKELYNFVCSLVPNYKVVNNDFSLLEGENEIDILIPDLKIAIEYNGLYWHSDASNANKKRHINKWEKIKDKDYSLIVVWEDDWISKRKIIEKMIAYKLLSANEVKVPARKLIVNNKVSKKAAEEFLNENHIQGYSNFSIYMSLNDDSGRMKAILGFKERREGHYEITRYASEGNVQGGFTRLLAKLEEYKKPITVTTFSDNSLSRGNLYEKSGFIAAEELKEDYSYLVDNKRTHKFSLRKSRIKTKEGMVYSENLTERQLTKLNNIPRIWDYGKIKWVKYLT